MISISHPYIFLYFQGIFITRVIPDGPAANILQPGDKLLEVGRDEPDFIFHPYLLLNLKTYIPVCKYWAFPY